MHYQIFSMDCGFKFIVSYIVVSYKRFGLQPENMGPRGFGYVIKICFLKLKYGYISQCKVKMA